MDINSAFSFLLFLLLVVIWLIPSGEECPECKSHFTAYLKGRARRKSDDKEVDLEFKCCYRCRAKWDVMIDGQPEDKL